MNLGGIEMSEVKPIKITETVLRDAHQSLIATRMPTDFMLPIVEKMDKVGYNSVECWDLKTPRYRCCSVARIFWVTDRMQMM